MKLLNLLNEISDDRKREAKDMARAKMTGGRMGPDEIFRRIDIAIKKDDTAISKIIAVFDKELERRGMTSKRRMPRQ